jgi:hypothetical protein
MPVTRSLAPTLSPRQQAIGQITDLIDNEAHIAEAIDLAIIGKTELCGFGADDLSALVTAHIDRLREISAKLSELND